LCAAIVVADTVVPERLKVPIDSISGRPMILLLSFRA
jgi:hypothetical protein